jgi:hypothetical protein
VEGLYPHRSVHIVQEDSLPVCNGDLNYSTRRSKCVNICHEVNMFYVWLVPLVLLVALVMAIVFLAEEKLGGGVRNSGTVLRHEGDDMPDPPP